MALIQAVAADAGGSGGSLAITIAATAANSVIVVPFGSPVSITGPTVTDNKSNTYTQVFLDTSGTDVSPSALFICTNPASGVTQVTIGGTSVAKITGYVLEESGLLSSGTVDQQSLNANQSFTSTPTTANVTTTSTNEVAYSFAFFGNGTLSQMTAGTGWTAVTGTGITSGQHDNATAGSSMFVQRQVLSSTATIAGLVNASGATGYDSGIVTLIATIATLITPSAGAVSEAGVAPTIILANNTVVTPFVA